VLGVLFPVLGVGLRQCLVVDDEQVLGVALLGALREVEAPGDDGLAVDDDDFVVGDGVPRVDPDGYSCPPFWLLCRLRDFLLRQPENTPSFAR
jgi:hypothetical protein